MDVAKKLVCAWVDAVNRGDSAAIADLLSDDFEFLCMARQPEWLRYSWNKAQFASIPQTQSAMLVEPINLNIVRLISEGDCAVLEADTDALLKNGQRYDNAYSFIFRIDDGKIREMREYSCSHLVVQCFGQFEPAVSS